MTLMRYNKIIFLQGVLIFTFNIVYGQKGKSALFGINFNPRYTIPILTNTANVLFGEDSKSFSIGIDFSYDRGSRLQFKTGLSYFRLNSIQKDFSPTFPCDIRPSSVIENSFINDKHRLNYIGLPVGLRVKLLGNQNHVYLSLGIEMFYRISDSHESTLFVCGSNEINLDSNLIFSNENIYLNCSFGIGYEFGLTKKIKLYFEPNFEASINKPVKFVESMFGPFRISKHFIQIGFMTGVRF